MFWKIIGMSVPTSSVQLFVKQALGSQLDTKFRSFIFVRTSVSSIRARTFEFFFRILL